MIEGNIIITYHNRYYEKIGKNEPADITNDLPFEIPETWTWIRFNEIFEIRNGFTPLKSNKEFWTNGTIPWFTIEDKHIQGEIITDTIKKINQKCVTNERIVPANSVLLCCTASIGEVVFTKIPLTSNQQFNGISIRKDYNDILFPLFVFEFCKTLKEKLISMATSTTFGFVSVKKISSLFMPVPPLEEQERIVKRIEELMPLVDEYARLEVKDKELDDKLPGMLKQSILQYAMEGKLVKQNPDDEPASVLLDRIKLEKERLIKEGKIKRDKNETLIIQDDDKNYYENNQLFLSLDNFIRVSSGKGINVRNLDYLKKYPVYGGNGIVGTANEYLVNKNTIIIGRVGANCGCVHLTNEKAFVTDNALIVKIISSYIYNDYLLYALKSIDYKNSISSTAQPLISGKTIYMKKIYFTNMKEQKNIVHKLNQIENVINFL